jgi:hypothetical protein
MPDRHALTQAHLAQFTGTETWFRHGLNRRILYTEGAKYVAEHGGAYWLLDEIALAQNNPNVAGEEFQVWKLTLAADRSALLVCEDGNGNVIVSQRIPFSDFPLPTITLWFANDTIYLPSEH